MPSPFERSRRASKMLEIEPVRLAEIAGCAALSDEASWNQTTRDWEYIIAEGECYGIRQDGQLIATAAFVPYGSLFAWICMVLVTKTQRRKGHASRLMKHCLERLDGRALIKGLDATHAGSFVYQELGFEAVQSIVRLRADRLGEFPSKPRSDIEPMSSGLLGAVAAYDRAAFHADRSTLLCSLHARLPEVAYISRGDGDLRGMVLGREGRTAVQIGPIVAEDEVTAIALIDAALYALRARSVIIDVPNGQRSFTAWLKSAGFAEERSFTRMLVGRRAPIGDTERTMAIAGPEFS
jgi:GNAT superfamily N-acetyltransferase